MAACVCFLICGIVTHISMCNISIKTEKIILLFSKCSNISEMLVVMPDRV